VTDEEKPYGHFMQDGATTRTVNNSMDALDEIFSK
jgi:hypothetical protein